MLVAKIMFILSLYKYTIKTKPPLCTANALLQTLQTQGTVETMQRANCIERPFIIMPSSSLSGLNSADRRALKVLRDTCIGLRPHAGVLNPCIPPGTDVAYDRLRRIRIACSTRMIWRILRVVVISIVVVMWRSSINITRGFLRATSS